MLRRNDDYTVRYAPASPGADDRLTAMRDVDIVICITGATNAPELPDGTGFAETEVATARRLGIRVLAYAHDGAVTPSLDHDPLRMYSIARARRFKTSLRDHYGVRRFTTPEELVAGVAEDLDGMRADAKVSSPSAIRQIHRRLRAGGSLTFDAFAVSLHNMDAMFRVTQIAPGREEYVDPPRYAPGGGSANVVFALARLGIKTGVAGCVADDADGNALRANLEHVGVNTDLLVQLDPDSDIRTGRTTILADGSGRRTILTEAGANSRFAATVTDRGLRQSLLNGLIGSRIALLTTFQTMAERQLQEELLQQLPAETIVAFTPGSLYMSPGAGRLAPLIGRTNVIFISEEALSRLLDDLVPHMHDRSASIPQKAHALIQWRHDLGGSRDPLMIVVRRPWRGSDTHDQSRNIFLCWGLQGYEGGVGTDGRLGSDDIDLMVDSTGTGGAIAAGALYGLLSSRPPEDCANLAYVLAMCTTTRYGSRDGVPSREDIGKRWCQWLKVDAAPSWLESPA
jgi:sugar/nucleoside kinase (ribokinase family)